MTIKFIHGDCLLEIEKMREETIDCVITSPPYNLGIKYGKYKDDLPRDSYLKWINDITIQVERVLKSEGHFFLNVGYTNQDPWVAMDVAQIVRKHMILQNNITWVKHIKINKDTYGIYKPIGSKRFTTPTNESIFHFTKNGKIEVNRTSISGEYAPRKGKYASSYTEKASKNRHECDLRRRVAKSLHYKDWREALEKKDFQQKYAEMLKKHPFKWNPPKDEGNTWYVPYTPIAKLAKEIGSTAKGTKKTGRGSHPATFPVGLPERCIKFAGLKEKSTILDPFVGSGTTMLACKILNINGIGIDMDKTYLDFAEKRITLY